MSTRRTVQNPRGRAAHPTSTGARRGFLNLQKPLGKRMTCSDLPVIDWFYWLYSTWPLPMPTEQFPLDSVYWPETPHKPIHGGAGAQHSAATGGASHGK
ncbi:hypothetical protein M8818_005713 [Zalaria obscura]|uniref:Uncharacterized protein n=1 Tax=Zalaria obscura TaxID=2024903 RepID=A0ACC3SAK8_9PEZI